MVRGLLLLGLVGLIFLGGVLFLDAVLWGKREGIVKTDNVGEEDDEA